MGNGLFRCQNKRCKLCHMYIQQCKEFTVSNGKSGKINCRITCNSINVIYSNAFISNASNVITHILERQIASVNE